MKCSIKVDESNCNFVIIIKIQVILFTYALESGQHFLQKVKPPLAFFKLFFNILPIENQMKFQKMKEIANLRELW